MCFNIEGGVRNRKKIIFDFFMIQLLINNFYLLKSVIVKIKDNTKTKEKKDDETKPFHFCNSIIYNDADI
ncbi:hypothetical protein MHK_004445 [Candidatus Magnetomorum sp. HK-1]|nr:hypothetical protein MHK_004445 [Candidatus Magnetomorum sp. HK-1]